MGVVQSPSIPDEFDTETGKAKSSNASNIRGAPAQQSHMYNFGYFDIYSICSFASIVLLFHQPSGPPDSTRRGVLEGIMPSYWTALVFSVICALSSTNMASSERGIKSSVPEVVMLPVEWT